MFDNYCAVSHAVCEEQDGGGLNLGADGGQSFTLQSAMLADTAGACPPVSLVAGHARAAQAADSGIADRVWSSMGQATRFRDWGFTAHCQASSGSNCAAQNPEAALGTAGSGIYGTACARCRGGRKYLEPADAREYSALRQALALRQDVRLGAQWCNCLPVARCSCTGGTPEHNCYAPACLSAPQANYPASWYRLDATSGGPERFVGGGLRAEVSTPQGGFFGQRPKQATA